MDYIVCPLQSEEDNALGRRIKSQEIEVQDIEFSEKFVVEGEPERQLCEWAKKSKGRNGQNTLLFFHLFIFGSHYGTLHEGSK